MVTEPELERPAPFVAEQVTCVPTVSVVKVVDPQPEDEAMPDSGSETVQLTVTSLLYQPLPLALGVITGGVLSLITRVKFRVKDCPLPAEIVDDWEVYPLMEALIVTDALVPANVKLNV
jgi:hypothetical protein